MLSHKRELLNWWAMPLWTHDKIPKAIGAEHIQFHDPRYAYAALSLKNRGGRKTVIWGCRATIRMDPPFAPIPIPHPKRSRALGAPSASIYGKTAGPAFAGSAVCQCSDLPVSLFSKPFSAQDFHLLHAVPPEQLQRFRANSLTGHRNGDRRRTPHGRGAADPAQ